MVPHPPRPPPRAGQRGHLAGGVCVCVLLFPGHAWATVLWATMRTLGPAAAGAATKAVRGVWAARPQSASPADEGSTSTLSTPRARRRALSVTSPTRVSGGSFGPSGIPFQCTLRPFVAWPTHLVPWQGETDVLEWKNAHMHTQITDAH